MAMKAITASNMLKNSVFIHYDFHATKIANLHIKDKDNSGYVFARIALGNELRMKRIIVLRIGNTWQSRLFRYLSFCTRSGARYLNYETKNLQIQTLMTGDFHFLRKE